MNVGWTFYQCFLLKLGSSLPMWMASLASQVIWEGSLSMMLKSALRGRVTCGEQFVVVQLLQQIAPHRTVSSPSRTSSLNS